jgi:hypothetical protein
MGLFKKKKDHKFSGGSVSSVDFDEHVHRRSSSDVRREGVRHSKDVELEKLRREKSDRSANVSHTQSSTKPLKLRLRKSFGNLFVDKNEHPPPLPTSTQVHRLLI